MNLAAIFPFEYPLPTAFYLFWYVLTLVIHVVFMNYVLGGITYLGLSSLAGRPNRNQLALMLRDWMPFAIGVAITAGVAPLLFIQILYQKAFYTANLLLFHRWMIILPILIVGFYLTYLLKAKKVADWPYAVRVLLGLASFACFAFMFVISWRMTLIIIGAAAALGLVICPFGAYIGVLTRRYRDALGQAASCRNAPAENT